MKGAPLPPARLIGHSGVHINVDILDALLCPAVAGPAVPPAFANFNILNLREHKAAPFPSRWQAARAFACELIHQGFLYSVGMAKDVRADLTIEALVVASDLLLIEDRLVE
jgi:hypothetical protein